MKGTRLLPEYADTAVEALFSGTLADPFTLLGGHAVELKDGPGQVIRAAFPGALSVSVLGVDPGGEVKAALVDQRGLFEAVLPGVTTFSPYRLKVEFAPGHQASFYDCYSFLPVLSDFDLFLFSQGNNYKIYEKLGAHPITHQGVSGVLFAVWAPSAARVSLVGDFNQWDGRRNQMRSRGASGVWELFVPHVSSGAVYKFEVRTQNGTVLLKADPYAFQMEERPKTASVVRDIGNFEWTDQAWMEQRAAEQVLSRPMSIYEVHPGSWRRRPDEGNRWLTYREMAEELIPYVKDLGFNYIQFMPLAEHPFDGSWGYQVSGYYAPTSRFGGPRDLMHLIDRCHAEGLGVILDWVPAHFPRDPHALEYFDGTHLYEHADPRLGAHQDWGTLIFNYGRSEVKNFLVANALYWLDKYHIDGLRVDAVASMLYLDYSRKDGEWLPNRYGGRENLEALELIKTLNTKVYELFPGAMTIAEESTAWPGVSKPVYLGGLGFMFKWNMGWMHDMLSFMSKDPVHRRFHMDKLTFALLYAFHENFVLPLSHDEVVHGKASLLSKMPGDDWRKFANLRLLFTYMYGEPGKKMLFMGSEIGQWREWSHDEQLDWGLLEYPLHRGLQDYLRDLNRLYHAQPAMYERDFQPEGFEWIDFRDADSSVVSFIRRGIDPEDVLVFVFNFTPIPRMNYRIGVPRPGFYQEMINSDSELYGGSNVGMAGGAQADSRPWHGQPYSLEVTMPPLGALILKPF